MIKPTISSFYVNLKNAGNFIGEARAFVSKKGNYQVSPAGLYYKAGNALKTDVSKAAAIDSESLVAFDFEARDGFYKALTVNSEKRSQLVTPEALMSKKERENRGDDFIHSMKSFKTMLGNYLKEQNANVKIGYTTPTKESFEVRIFENKNNSEIDAFNITPFYKDEKGVTFSQKLFLSIENLINNSKAKH